MLRLTIWTILLWPISLFHYARIRRMLRMYDRMESGGRSLRLLLRVIDILRGPHMRLDQAVAIRALRVAGLRDQAKETLYAYHHTIYHLHSLWFFVNRELRETSPLGEGESE